MTRLCEVHARLFELRAQRDRLRSLLRLACLEPEPCLDWQQVDTNIEKSLATACPTHGVFKVAAGTDRCSNPAEIEQGWLSKYDQRFAAKLARVMEWT